MTESKSMFTPMADDVSPEVVTTKQVLHAIDHDAAYAVFTEAERKSFRDYVAKTMPAMDALSDAEFDKSVIIAPLEHILVSSVVSQPVVVLHLPSAQEQAQHMRQITENAERALGDLHGFLFGKPDRKRAIFAGNPRAMLLSMGSVVISKLGVIPEHIGELNAFTQGVATEIVRRAKAADRLRIIGVYTPRGKVVDCTQFGTVLTLWRPDASAVENKCAEFKGDVSARVKAKVHALFKEETRAELRNKICEAVDKRRKRAREDSTQEPAAKRARVGDKEKSS